MPKSELKIRADLSDMPGDKRERISISLPGSWVDVMDSCLRNLKRAGLSQYPLPNGKRVPRTKSAIIESLLNTYLVDELKRLQTFIKE